MALKDAVGRFFGAVARNRALLQFMLFCTFNDRPLQSNSATRMARLAPARIDPAYSTDCYREDYRTTWVFLSPKVVN
jgi:hypothetical protein